MTPEEIATNYFNRIQRGQHLMEVARWREALHEFNQILASSPQDYFCLCSSAACHFYLGEYQTAYDTTKIAIESEPEEEWAYRLQVIIFTHNGEHDRALKAARSCVEKSPELPEALHCLFEAEANYGNLDDAERTLERYCAAAPNDSTALESKGYLNLKRERFLEAEKDYLEAIRLSPENANAFNNLGFVYLRMFENGSGKRYKKKSMEMFERAVKLEPTFKLAQDNMKAASNATRSTVAVGGVIGLLFALNAIMRLASNGVSASDQKLKSIALADLNPLVDNLSVTFINLLFLMLLGIEVAVLVLLIFKKHRQFLLHYLTKKLFLGIGFAVHTILSAIFIFVVVASQGAVPVFEEIAGAVSIFSAIAFVSAIIWLTIYGADEKSSIFSA